MKEIDRRRFLRLAAGAGGAALTGLLLGCERRARLPAKAPSPLAAIARDLPGDTTFGLQVFLGAGELLVGREERLPFGIAKPDGIDLDGARARVWIAGGPEPAGPFDAPFRTYARAAEPDESGFYLTRLPVPDAAVADLMVAAEAGGRTYAGFATFQPRARPHVPAPGDPAVPVATPTFGHPRGVANVCTRTPPCPMHDVRLDHALAAGRPIVLTIASPRLCSSRTCGPVVDEVTIVRESLRDQAAFIHAEVYKGDTPTITSPTFRRWRLESEPWTFVIDARGTVRARFEGPVVADEIAASLRTVI